jgi:hypothetical protein
LPGPWHQPLRSWESAVRVGSNEGHPGADQQGGAAQLGVVDLAIHAHHHGQNLPVGFGRILNLIEALRLQGFYQAGFANDIDGAAPGVLAGQVVGHGNCRGDHLPIFDRNTEGAQLLDILGDGAGGIIGGKSYLPAMPGDAGKNARQVSNRLCLAPQYAIHIEDERL